MLSLPHTYCEPSKQAIDHTDLLLLFVQANTADLARDGNLAKRCLNRCQILAKIFAPVNIWSASRDYLDMLCAFLTKREIALPPLFHRPTPIEIQG